MKDRLQNLIRPLQISNDGFGLSNTPASFQGYIDKILVKNLNVVIIVYLDDMLIYTKDKGQDHVKAVQ